MPSVETLNNLFVQLKNVLEAELYDEEKAKVKTKTVLTVQCKHT